MWIEIHFVKTIRENRIWQAGTISRIDGLRLLQKAYDKKAL
jgi:hypothetical protein